MMKMNVMSGASIAAAAVALTLSGVSLTTTPAKAAGSVHCMGINSCKGKSACKTVNNACKGQNSCKGQGFLLTKSAKVCKAKGGTVG
jgi:hypothetical protein